MYETQLQQNPQSDWISAVQQGKFAGELKRRLTMWHRQTYAEFTKKTAIATGLNSSNREIGGKLSRDGYDETFLLR
jgi:hypothetical protein